MSNSNLEEIEITNDVKAFKKLFGKINSREKKVEDEESEEI